MHCDSVFNDVRVRRALSKAINRDEINTVYYGGEGTETHNPHLIPTASYWNPEWDRNFQDEYGYDPTVSRQLLAEAGYGPDNPLELLIDGTPSGGLAEKADQAETILGYFQDIGIKATLDQRDAATTRAIGRSFGFNLRVTFMGSNIYETQAFRVHHFSGASPRGGPEFDGLEQAIAGQRSTVDPVKALDGLRNVGYVSFPLHIALPLFWAPDDILFDPGSSQATSVPACRSVCTTACSRSSRSTSRPSEYLTRAKESPQPTRAGGFFMCNGTALGYESLAEYGLKKLCRKECVWAQAWARLSPAEGMSSSALVILTAWCRGPGDSGATAGNSTSQPRPFRKLFRPS